MAALHPLMTEVCMLSESAKAATEGGASKRSQQSSSSSSMSSSSSSLLAASSQAQSPQRKCPAAASPMHCYVSGGHSSVSEGPSIPVPPTTDQPQPSTPAAARTHNRLVPHAIVLAGSGGGRHLCPIHMGTNPGRTSEADTGPQYGGPLERPVQGCPWLV